LEAVKDITTIKLLEKKVIKIINDMYDELDRLIIKELIDNINRNSKLLFDIADIEKTLGGTTTKSILMNRNTKHSVSFELTRNKNKLIKKIVNTIKSNEDMSMINKRIKNMVYKKVYGKTKGDGAKTLRTFRTEYTRTRTMAKLEAIELLNKDGYKTTLQWLYTFESKVPRPSHLHSDGIIAGEDGYFIIDGYKTKGPGLFGIASEDINCRCDTECIIRPTND